MKPKIKLLMTGFFIGVAVAVRPYDFSTFALCVIAALIGADAWAQTETRKQTHAEWRAATLKKPLP